MIGKTLAHYEIVELIGRGGMGEVYRARDPKLDREVALKLLPAEFALDGERVARFQREARTLASLSHPNIAQIYGLEQDGAHRFLVMELVEGEELSERLGRGAVPLDETIEIAEQIAQALEGAHEQGVIHRDLKPANVKITSAGQVKLLDFGLARAIVGGGDEDSDPATSPTITAAFTQAGTILGTAAYMSPEQARGKPVDRRADIWAFGTVLFEMLSGRRLFGGETASDTLASVIKERPDFDQLPDETPAWLLVLIERCLEKDPRRRLQSIGEARIAIERGRSGDASSLISTGPSSVDVAVATGSGRRTVAWAAAVIVVGALGVLAGLRLATPEHTPRQRMFTMQPVNLAVSYPTNPALSPDGRYVAYFEGTELRIRDLHALDAVTVENSDGATAPFWSPDGRWLAFGLRGRIYKVPATGGQPDVVCNVNFTTLDGATWSDDDTMILAPDAGPLYRVSANGGDAIPLFPLGPTESDYHTPTALPDGRGILFTRHDADGRETIEILVDGERRVLLKIPGARLEYATWSPRPGSTTEGHILYHRLNSNPGLWAMPFTLDGYERTGEPFLLDSDGAYPSIARDGSLLYSNGAGTGPLQLVEVARDGRIVRRLGSPREGMSELRVSPDGRSVLLEIDDAGNTDIWRLDVERGTHTRLTFEDRAERTPGWFDGGTYFLYSMEDNGWPIVWKARIDGTGEPVQLVRGYQAVSSANTDRIVFTRFDRTATNGLYHWSAAAGDSGQAFLQTPANEAGPDLSPDGRWVAYMSNESASNEVYLKPFPSGEGKWQISIGGGAWPRWSADGTELIYRRGSGGNASIMAVRVQTEPTVELSAPEVLFTATQAPTLFYRAGFAAYDPLPDSKNLLMYERVDLGMGVESCLVFVEDWRTAFGVE